ncbi:MAG: hypothetical protein IKD50_02305 [Clostridia bacterium]|nr:hypothetical protein [Clostridia bacterium]
MMKKPFLCLVALILMLFSASALAAGSDEALITDTLRQAGITEPVQLTQWGDTAACFAETDGVKRLVVLKRHDGAWQIMIDNPTALIQKWDWPELYSAPTQRFIGSTKNFTARPPWFSAAGGKPAYGVRWKRRSQEMKPQAHRIP